jgi:hypothetical protein
MVISWQSNALQKVKKKEVTPAGVQLVWESKDSTGNVKFF